MNIRLFPYIRNMVRLASYSLVLGPALVLYSLVVVIALDDSLLQQFLNEARRLTDGAPAGKVMQCIEHNAPPLQPRISRPEEDVTPLPYNVPVSSNCHLELVDSSLWTRTTDAVLFNFWVMAVLLGALTGFLAHLNQRGTTTPPGLAVLEKEKQNEH
ncbi:hypothetical protein [Lelliottia nimipressuralis]|uniref:Uncharacterized protein n=1 Tax=Lelliottia nimipressuralis TaxID=69220 RepID=A0ABD4KFH1_9ENTR|nr:hypothetical protein [Lelliottia nimipressuralis]MBF4180621.1 hypothetical protein [Lelliottia nimipressuralis]